MIVGVDNQLLYHDFGVNHDEFEGVLAWSGIEGHFEPTDVVEHFVTTG